MQAHETLTAAVTLDDVAAASERIRALARITPVLTSRSFDQRAGSRTLFKCENLQRGGSFKIRGAFNFIAQLTPEQRKRGIVTFSSGNHAQAVAIAAAYAGVNATIVIPTDAPRAKLEATQAYKPNLVFYDRLRDDREEIANRIAASTGAVTVPSYDHPWIIAGQGTIAYELLRDHPEIDTLAVPLGGGGMLSGALVVARALRPGMDVIGVEPELANDWQQSLARGERLSIPPPQTIADGLRTPAPGEITFATVSALGGKSATVSEIEIRSTMRFLLSRMKVLAEPSGAVAAAAVLHQHISAREAVGVVLSGGNVDFDLLSEILREAN